MGNYQGERVLRAPREGVFEPVAEIGQMLRLGEVVAQVDGEQIIAPFDGILRGVMQHGLSVREGEKVGDIDPRGDPRLCWMVSEKALAVGGGVLEAVLAWRAREGGC